MKNLEFNYPSIIDNTNFRYLTIDGKYVKSLIITKIGEFVDFLEIVEALPKDFIYDLTFDVRKQNTMNILKEITYNIGASSSEIKTSKNNQIDIDILNKIKNDAKDLRRKIQIDNEEVFYINIIITFFSDNLLQLEQDIKMFQSRIYSKGLISNIANFRNLNSYLFSLPIINFQEAFFKSNYLNLTTNSMSTIFPFYEKTIFDKNGIIFGFTKQENKMCCIDVFSEKYLNSNMCILGSSGAGKSYFTKLLILRNYLMGIHQYIFDIEKEYSEICDSLNLPYVEFNNKKYKYNILQIFDYEVFPNFFTNKIEDTSKFILLICKLDLDTNFEKLCRAIRLTYNKFNINEDLETIYQKSDENNILIERKLIDKNKFPTITDLVENIDSVKLKKVIKDKIINKYQFLDGITNIDLSDELLIFSTHNLDIEATGIITEYFIKKINDYRRNIKINTNKYIIYIDEIWKYINTSDKYNISNTILDMYKSIRKNGGSITIITQDISDFFKAQNGNLGKVILNNSSFKFFFRMDYTDLDILKRLNIIGQDEIRTIFTLDKGETLFTLKNNKTILNIKASEFERKVLEQSNENSNSIK